jgi:protein-S-isoprenylcysteine O-methyltransferase Ste14
MMTQVVNVVHVVSSGETLRAILFKIRYGIVLVAFLFFVWAVDSSWFVYGFVVALVGELTQVWCFASLDKNQKLATEGPYMFTRNPMYIGRYVLLVGCVLTTGHPWAIPVLSVGYYFYVVNRIKREERRLQKVFGKAYADYCKKVNRFVPTLQAVQIDSLFLFKWRLLVQNHGLQNLAAMLMGFLLLYWFGCR